MSNLSRTLPDCIVMSFPYPTFWTDVYCESIVQHDPRLRSIQFEHATDFDRIFAFDRLAAMNDDRIASHPLFIYLNRNQLASQPQKFKRINKNVIYERHKPAHALFTNALDFEREFMVRSNAYSSITINPRNRWFKLYERNPRFTFTISALSTQLNQAIEAQSRFTDDEPNKRIPRCIVIPMDKYLKCYKVRIYHRQAWNPMEEGASFPSIWKEPDPSASVDDVSGVALGHITLLCRDVIFECNKCTTGCSPDKRSKCDTCKLDFEVIAW